MPTRRLLAAAVLLLASGTPATPQEPAPIGVDFRVNSYTTAPQVFPAVAVRDDGSFIVVWSDGRNPAFNEADIFGQRFDANGVPQGGEFQVNTTSAEYMHEPVVGVDAAGNFVVVWGQGFYDYAVSFSTGDIMMRRFDPSGVPLGPQTAVNISTAVAWRAGLSVAPGGDFVVAWVDEPSRGVLARRFDAAGNAAGDPFAVSSSGGTADIGSPPALAKGPTGEFDVIWAAGGTAGEIMGRSFDAGGHAEGPEFQVSVSTTTRESEPALARAPDGSLFALWATGQPETSIGDRFMGRRLADDGTPLAPQFQISSAWAGRQDYAGIAGDGAGNFMVVWEEYSRVMGRAFGPGGPLGDDFRVHGSTGGGRWPGVAGNADGQFVVTWHGGSPGTGGGYDVFARRFGPDDLIFADDFEGGDTSAWSAEAPDAGDLSVTGGAALHGSFGLQAVVDDAAGIYVEDTSPLDDQVYRARFHLDTNGFDPGEAQGHYRVRVFVAFEEAPTRRLMAIVLKRRHGQYALIGRARLANGRQADTAPIPISDGPHAVEVHWRGARSNGIPDGLLTLWVDGAEVASLTDLLLGPVTVDFARLGVLSPKGGASGTLLFDEFVSRRRAYIGPVEP